MSDLSERTAVNGNGTRRLDEKSRSTATQRATNAGLEGSGVVQQVRLAAHFATPDPTGACYDDGDS